MKCVMCGDEARYIDEKTGEALCERCVHINETIYRERGKAGRYREVK